MEARALPAVVASVSDAAGAGGSGPPGVAGPVPPRPADACVSVGRAPRPSIVFRDVGGVEGAKKAKSERELRSAKREDAL